MWVRRGHLYLGLFLLPWAILYGATAFLFNHPTAFSDQPTATFGPDALVGTPLEVPPSPQAIAERVVAALNEAQKPATPYALAGPAAFGREFAFATVEGDGQTVSVLIDVKNGGGTVRSTPARVRAVPEKAPFAVSAGGGSGPGDAPRGEGGIKLDDPLPARVKAAVPAILARVGFPTGDATVTSVPDVVFPVAAGGRTWTARYNPTTGAVAGTAAEGRPESEQSWRRFLLRLHTAHGYPGETDERWVWALVVDAMAYAMCFWGLSGLVMWWQLKAARKAGAAVLAFSLAAAAALGSAMHAAMTG